ncbi:Uncharacterised protein [uncultured archaeon]|nr:Uncharacterised protein [uncultured archaeon]
MIPFNKGKKKIEWEKAKIYTKICPTCKKEIKTERKTQIYCNRFCYFKSEKLSKLAKESKLIKNNLNNQYHKGYKHSLDTKERIRDNPFRHTFIKGKTNPGVNKSKETILKIKEKRLYQKILKKDTKPELIIQNLLTELNIPFIKHQPITDIVHKYQCDIIINKKIIIECDGDYYHNYPSGREIDKIRTKELQNKGYIILRLWEHEIKSNLEFCKDKILEVIK